MSKQLGSRFVTGGGAVCGGRCLCLKESGNPQVINIMKGIMSYHAGISIMHNYIRVSLLLK